jgi:rhodanese-related sulfurtransferase
VAGFRSPISGFFFQKEQALVHSPAFEQLCEEARARVREISIAEVKAKLDAGERFHFLDVREDHEWQVDHAAGAEHLGRGILERDIHLRVPETEAEIVLYCGGGYRSALAADNLQRMGYSNVFSMAGGIRAWREAHYPLESGAPSEEV